jgi:hypothetical protein
MRSIRSAVLAFVALVPGATGQAGPAEGRGPGFRQKRLAAVREANARGPAQAMAASGAAMTEEKNSSTAARKSAGV